MKIKLLLILLVCVLLINVNWAQDDQSPDQDQLEPVKEEIKEDAQDEDERTITTTESTTTKDKRLKKLMRVASKDKLNVNGNIPPQELGNTCSCEHCRKGRCSQKRCSHCNLSRRLSKQPF